MSNLTTSKDSYHMISYRLVSHCKPLGPIISELEEDLKVKSDHIRRFLAHDFAKISFTLQTSRTNNKRAISTYSFGYPRLTLEEGP